MNKPCNYPIQSLEELPPEAFLPSRLVLSPEAFQQVMDLIENPPEPTHAMLELMHADPDSFFSRIDRREGFGLSPS